MSEAHEHTAGCREMLERLSEYIDGELDEALCRRIEKHCATCPPCVAFVESLRRTSGLVATLDREPLSPEARRALIEACERGRGSA